MRIFTFTPILVAKALTDDSAVSACSPPWYASSLFPAFTTPVKVSHKKTWELILSNFTFLAIKHPLPPRRLLGSPRSETLRLLDKCPQFPATILIHESMKSHLLVGADELWVEQPGCISSLRIDPLMPRTDGLGVVHGIPGSFEELLHRLFLRTTTSSVPYQSCWLASWY